MNRRQFSLDQIAAVLKQLDVGRTIRELSREYGLCEQTIYLWRSRFRGMNSNEIRLSMLEQENRCLKRLVSDLTYERDTLKGVVRRTRSG